MPGKSEACTFEENKPKSNVMQNFLTNREREVLHLLSKDFTSRELAGSLYISFETVKSHRQNLLRKLGVKTTGGLVRKGFELGLLSI